MHGGRPPGSSSAADAAAGVANEIAGAGPGGPPPGSSSAADAAVAVAVDVTDEDGIAGAFRQAALAFGGVDLVVNNAGLSISKPLLETTAADWDLQHDVMARGSFLVSRQSARIMIAQRMGGDIIYICSKERGLRRAGQRRVRGGQGRPGASGAVARG